MTTRDFKVIDYKEYKMAYHTKITSKIEDIIRWNSLVHDLDGIMVPCIYAEANGNKLEIEFHPDKVSEKDKAKMTGIIVKHLDKYPEINIVMLNAKFIPIGHRMNKNITRWSVPTNVHELMQDFTMEDLYNFSKLKPNKNQTIYRLWAVDNTLFYMNNTFVHNALAAIILDEYCDRSIPVSPETNKHEKVSYHGFALLYRYLHSLLGAGEISEHKAKDIYQAFDKKFFVPNIPTHFNLHHIENLETKNLTQFVFEPNFDEELEEIDMADLHDSQFPLMIGNFCGIDNFDHGADYFSLKRLLKLDVEESDLLFVFSDNYPVLIDSGIKFENKYVIKEQDIKGAFLNAGLLEIAVSDDIFNEKEFNAFETELEDYLKEMYLDGVTIYPYGSKMGEKLADDYAEFLRRLN